MDRMPVFVKVPDDVTIKDMVMQARAKIESAKSSLETIEALSKEEASKISEWNTNFESINKRIEQIKYFLLQPER